jgi:ABC-type glycerol-3-phosphate transport system substrate-binding protein
MKSVIKYSGYLLIAAFFVVAFSGCTKKAATDTTSNEIVVWSFEEEDVWKSLKKDFISENKTANIVYEKQVMDSGYENRVLNSILSGQGPDVWAMPNDWVYRHKDKLVSIDKSEFDLSKYVPSVADSVQTDDKIYALTPYSEPLMIYYNDKLIQKTLDEYSEKNSGRDQQQARTDANNLLNSIPKTWTDFTKAIKLLTQKDSSGKITIAGAALGTGRVTNANDILYLLMLQNETKITTSDYNLATFNLPNQAPIDTAEIPGQRALDFYTSFSNPKSTNYTWDDSLGNDVEAFTSGKVAMIFGYDTLQNTFAQKYPDFQYKKAFVPQLNQESDKIIDYARFNAYGVSAHSRNGNTALSWDFVKMLAANGDIVSGKNVYTAQKASSYDISLANRDSSNPEKLSLATARSFIKGRYPTDFDQSIKNMIYAVNNGIQDSKSALDLSAVNITDLLRKENWN